MASETTGQNRYTHMSNEALDAEWSRMLHDYAERLEYFDSLPEWQRAANLGAIASDPGSWGLTRGEVDDWGDLLQEHYREARKLSAAYAARHERLRESERMRVSRLSDPDEARAAADAHVAAFREDPGHKADDETMLGYVLRVEAANDERALGIGARRGADELSDAVFAGMTVDQLRADRERERKRREAELRAKRERRRRRAGGKR